MLGPDLDVFFSCSFRKTDESVNEFFRAICAGLKFSTINVATGYAELPPEKARDYISRSAGLIAVVTRREPLPDGGYAMPSAVREEIAFAYALGKRILLFVEDDVHMDGFMNNYGTRLTFDRAKLSEPALVNKTVASLYGFRIEAATEVTGGPNPYAAEYYSEARVTC